jgi:hypothetical protein
MELEVITIRLKTTYGVGDKKAREGVRRFCMRLHPDDSEVAATHFRSNALSAKRRARSHYNLVVNHQGEATVQPDPCGGRERWEAELAVFSEPALV